ncbi:RHS repeat protein [Chitinophaga varians]|uniref:RHS repeat protein n=1 Tax=Chitinophaga varians TaxID=2202339 RepID=A0A847RSP4_9BACT|nr:RHS repeat protein [Chitinophaga varians]NLR63797.1 RHS repeat protein [Chitinophaga varians]
MKNYVNRFVKSLGILFVLLYFIFMLPALVLGQDPNGNSTFNVIAPSPTAAAMDKFALVPVGYYTGVPNINIPVFTYTIPRLNYHLAIDMSYHSGGIKVDEMPSNVGIGWSLGAGGSVNRSTVGLPDDYPSVGFMYAPPFNQTKQMLERYSFGQEDSEPDVFTFNFNGISGKFYIGKRKNNVNQIMLATRSGVRIELLRSGLPANDSPIDGFIITNTDGVKYVFDVKETTATRYTNLGDVTYTSAWHLSKVVLPVPGISILYEYEGYHSVYTTGISQTREYLLKFNIPGDNPAENFRTSTGSVDIYGKRISRIVLPGNRDVRFKYGNARTDLPGDQQLDSIIYDTRNQRGVKLNYDYSVGNRLTLTSVQEFAGSQQKPAHVFTYNPGLPARLSYSQDHWGYHNGKNNVTLIPKLEDFEKYIFANTGTGTPPANSTLAGDRSVDSTAALAGLLNKITYPTGGTTTFEYEPNRVSDTIMRRYYRSKTESTFLNGYETTRSKVFSIYNDRQAGAIDFTFYFRDYPYGLDTRFAFAFDIKSLDGTKTYGSATFGYSDTNGKTVVRSNLLSMPAGQYQIVWSSTYTDPLDNPFTFSLKWNEIVPDSMIIPSFLTGGCRIRKIEVLDGFTNVIQSRSFRYVQEDGITSSGVMGKLPVYDRIYDTRKYKITEVGGQPVKNLSTATYFTRASNPTQAMLYTSGSPIGYQRVEEILPNGKNVYKYSSFKDSRSNVENLFPNPPAYLKDWELGLQKEMYAYDTNGKLVKKVLSYYQTPAMASEPGTLDALKAAQDKFAYDDGRDPSGETFVYMEYPTPMGCALQDSTVQTVYTSTGDSIVNRTHYTYESFDAFRHYQPLSIAEEISDGWKKSYFAYPTDYTAGTAFIDSMVNKNILILPVEQVSTKNNRITSGSATHYNPANPGMPAQTYRLETDQGIPYASFKFSNQLPGVLPAGNKSAFVKDSRYQPENTVTTGDAGCILSVQKNNDIPVSYLWGYQQQFPVARITGATYTQAASLVDLNVLNNPASDQQLRSELNKLRTGLNNATVSTYTYDPLLGATSETDPSGKTVYYEYDTFGRLKLIKDINGKIVKQFDYQYQVPAAQ